MNFSELYYTNDIELFAQLKLSHFLDRKDLQGLADWLNIPYTDLMDELPNMGRCDFSFHLYDLCNPALLADDFYTFNESFLELLLADGVNIQNGIVFYTNAEQKLFYERIHSAKDILNALEEKGRSISIFRGRRNPFYSVIVKNEEFPFGQVVYVVPESFLPQAIKLEPFGSLIFAEAEKQPKLQKLLRHYQLRYLPMGAVQEKVLKAFQSLVFQKKVQGQKLVNMCGALIEWTPDEMREKILSFCWRESKKKISEQDFYLATQRILFFAPDAYASGPVAGLVSIVKEAQRTLNIIQCSDIVYNLMSLSEKKRDAVLDKLCQEEDRGEDEGNFSIISELVTSD